MRTPRSLRALLAAVVLAAGVAPAQSGEVIVDFFANPGTGFADPTPAAPVGGNPGTTLGEQRIFVFLQAAAIWTEVLQPEQDIFVAAQFVPLAPNVLGSAGAQFIWSNFPGAELQNTWYFDSLADHLTQGDLSPPTYDIVASFSTNFLFYLGFDNNDPPGTSDLLAVVLHEMGHGLNFANAVTEATGSIPVPAGSTEAFGDIYSQYTLDVTTNKTWNSMTQAERAASALNARKVSWSGLHVKEAVPDVLEKGEPVLRVNTPSSLGNLMFGVAAFGPQLTSTGTRGDVIAGIDAADAAGPTVNDGCSALLNAVAGKIVLMDRGTCGFTVKVKNAQDAGAIAVVIADNVAGAPPPGLGGADPTIVIPSGRVTLADGTAIRAALAAGTVNVTMRLDRSILAGTDRVKGLMMLNATNPVQPGSSISHFEPVAFPNQLMEPAINVDLTSSVNPPEDLTTPLLTDLGWFTDRDGVQDGVDSCLGSNLSPTVLIGSCDSKSPNPVLPTGCSVSDRMNQCDVLRSKHPLLYVACIAARTEELVRANVITRKNQLGIAACALKSLK
jgi:hypothetical protein